MTDFNLLDSVKAIEAIMGDIQKNVPHFPCVFGYMPPGSVDPGYMMNDAENQQIALLAKMQAVLTGNCVARITEKEPEDKRVETPVTIAALPATLLDLIGKDGQALFPGPSLGQLWDASGTSSDWPYPIAELAQHSWSPVQNPSAHGAMRSAQSPQWHYITHDKFGAELYDWSVDPQETLNLAGMPDIQPVAEHFKTYLEDLVSNAADLLE